MRRKLAVLLAVATMASVLTACGGGNSTSQGTKGESGSSSSVQQVANFYMTADPDTLDPTRADDDVKNSISMEVQEGLVRMHSGKLEAAGATSWTVSDDGLTWTFKLRDNKYSDGSEVTAADYVNAVYRIFDPEVNCHNASIFYCIKGGEEYNTGKGTRDGVGVKAPDSKTLVFTLKEPIPYFEQLTNFSAISPIKASATEGANNSTYGSDAKGMFYSGPFYIDSWTRGSDVVLKKNPNYWDATNVKLEQVNFKLIQEEQTREQMFQQGQIDILRNAKTEFVGQLQSKIDSKDITLIDGASPSSSYICFNNNDPNKIFTNANVRRAFSLALDRESLVKDVLKKNKASYGLIPYGLTCGDTIFRDKVEDPLKSSTNEDPKALLQKGLQELGMDPSKPITVTFLQRNSDSDTKQQGEFYQNQWESKLGVTVKIDTASDSATFNQTVSKGLYQICQTGWGADYNDPMTFMQCWVTGDGNNAAFFSNAKYDELVNSCKTLADSAQRLEKFKEAEKILTVDEAGIAPLNYSFSKNLVGKRLQGAILNGAGGPLVEFRYASIG